MAFKQFRPGILFRIFLLTGTLLCLVYTLLQTQWHVTAFVLLALALAEIYNLVHFAETTNREVSQFLQSVHFRDFSRKVNPGGKGRSFEEMRNAFNIINTQFQKITAENEAHYQYLQAIVAHIGVGIIAYDSDGNISLYNDAASELLGIPYLKNINGLQPRHPRLAEIINTIKPKQTETISMEKNHAQIQLSVQAGFLKIQDKLLTIISLHDISLELKAREIEAWQKLISVLTHEIMNSITPIASLSGSSLKIVEALNEKSTPGMDDVVAGLKSIENRSKGLLNFVDVYRSLTRVPEPRLRVIMAKELLENVGNLMQKTFLMHKIRFEMIINQPELSLTADNELIEQVLINLTLNAIDAVKDKTGAHIRYIADMNDQHRPVLMVTDNGTGISEEVMDNIFVPFFTTKKNGSGIGLSLSQQIMKLHSGTLSVKTNPGEGSVFVLTF